MMHVVNLSQFESQFATNADDNTMIAIALDAPVKCYKANRDENGNVVEGVHEAEENQVVMSPKQLCFQLYAVDNRIAVLRGLRGKKLSFAVLAALLTGAEIDIEARHHAAGDVDEETGFVHDNPSFTHHIVGLKLEKSAEDKLKQTIDFDWLA